MLLLVFPVSLVMFFVLKEYFSFLVVSIMCMFFVVKVFNISMQYWFVNMFIFDEVSFWMSFITLVVCFFSYLLIDSKSMTMENLSLSLMFLLFSSLVVFGSYSMIWLYVFYEFSLLPIIFIIIYSGVYPDRSVSSVMMLIYTAFFSFPLMAVLVWLFFEKMNLFFFSFEMVEFPVLVTALVVLAFSVKLPLYGLHHWLPMAHVEAPTFGSMILAGVLLKMGGCGLVRFFSLVGSPSMLLNSLVFSYVVVVVIVASVVTSFQSDLKRLIAYSSVVHMSVLLLPLMFLSVLSLKSVILIMVSHAFSSPIMFLLTGSVYKFYTTRLLLFVRGFILVSPLLVFYLTLGLLLSIPTPPFLGFLGEFSMFVAFMNYSLAAYAFVFLFVFLAIVYNVYWYVSLLFGDLSFYLSKCCLFSFVDFVVAFMFGIYSFFLVFLN